MRHAARITEVVIIGLGSVALQFLLTAAVGSCLTPPEDWDEEYLVPWTCPEGAPGRKEKGRERGGVFPSVDGCLGVGRVGRRRPPLRR